MTHSATLLSKRPIQRRGVGTDVPVGKGRRAEGRAEGAAEKALSVARSLLAEGIPSETVARCIGLPVKEVKALQKKA